MKMYKSFSIFFIYACSISVGTMSWSYFAYTLNDSLSTVEVLLGIKDPYLGLKQGILVTSLAFGMFAGNMISFKIVKTTPRRRLVQIIDTLFIIGSILTMLQYQEMMILGRVVQGIGAGINAVTIPIFLKEISPPDIYSIIGGQNLVFYGTGTVICSSLGLLFPKEQNQSAEDISPYFWRLYFVVPIIFSSLRLIMITFVYQLDSPEYNQGLGRQDQVDKFIQQFYKPEFHGIVADIYKEKQQMKQSRKSDSIKNLFTTRLINKTKLGMLLNIAQQTTGVNAVVSYSTILFEEFVGVQMARILTLLIAVQKIFFYSSTVLVWQKYGRRRPIVVGTFILIVMNTNLAVLSYGSKQEWFHGTWNSVVDGVIIGSVFVYFIGFFHSLGAIAVYIPEFLPETGIVSCLVVQSITNIFITLTFPIIKQAFGISQCFALYAVTTLMAFIYIHFNCKETKGLSEADVDILFDSKKNYLYQKLVNGTMISDATESTILKN